MSYEDVVPILVLCSLGLYQWKWRWWSFL